ncbi:MAG: copper amine oxidase N-terminal domain-containing protein [Firmicutes bacterium]|nr:copper amine oxidase N-terminal domain-containing protein [Bacillota bacterium]
MRRLITFSIAFLLAISTVGTALASVGTNNVKVHYNNVMLLVDGNVVNTESEPFILNGTTYVPLRDIGNALGAKVQWDSVKNTVIISSGKEGTAEKYDGENVSSDESISSELDTTTSPINQSDATESKSARLEKLLFEKYGILKSVYFNDFELTGNSDEIKFNILINLTENNESWSGLFDSEIEKWLNIVVEEIQKAYDEETKVTGNFIRTENRNVLLDFKKDYEKRLKVRFYDGNYRTGVDITYKLPIEKEYVTKYFFVHDIKFKATSTNYKEGSGTAEIILSAVNGSASIDWGKLSTPEIKAAAKNICNTVANDFGNSNIELNNIYLTFKDKLNKGLEFFIYDVEESNFI